jgi:hypothetical protein
MEEAAFTLFNDAEKKLWETTVKKGNVYAREPK